MELPMNDNIFAEESFISIGQWKTAEGRHWWSSRDHKSAWSQTTGGSNSRVRCRTLMWFWKNCVKCFQQMGIVAGAEVIESYQMEPWLIPTSCLTPLPNKWTQWWRWTSTFSNPGFREMTPSPTSPVTLVLLWHWSVTTTKKDFTSLLLQYTPVWNLCDVFLRIQLLGIKTSSILLWRHSHCVWPTLPAPVRVRSRQDIRHTLLCTPLCASHIAWQSGRISNNVRAENRSSGRPMEDTSFWLSWILWPWSRVIPSHTNFSFWLWLCSLACGYLNPFSTIKHQRGGVTEGMH